MKILVTGAAGFIGSHLVNQLVQENYDVIGVDNLSAGIKENMQPALDSGALQFVVHDVREPLNYSFPHIDCIVHLAASGSVPRSIQEPSFFLDNNVVGFQNVLEFARKNTVKTVFFASSSSVYGDAKKFYRSESDEIKPKSPYAGSKVMNEIQAEIYSKCYGIDCHALRFFNVFGPNQKLNSPYAAVIPRFCQGIVETQQLTIFGNGEQIRTFTPVEFVVEAICGMMSIREKLKQPVVNITSSNYAISVNDLKTLMIRLLSPTTGVQLFNVASRNGDVKNSVGSGALLASILGEDISNQFPQLEALQATCKWYKEKLTPQ